MSMQNQSQAQIPQNSKAAGGTGAADEENFEDDCIASFSDEPEESIINNNGGYVSLTLNQQLQRQSKFKNSETGFTILQGIDQLIANPSGAQDNDMKGGPNMGGAPN